MLGLAAIVIYNRVRADRKMEKILAETLRRSEELETLLNGQMEKSLTDSLKKCEELESLLNCQIKEIVKEKPHLKPVIQSILDRSMLDLGIPNGLEPAEEQQN